MNQDRMDIIIEVGEVWESELDKGLRELARIDATLYAMKIDAEYMKLDESG